MPGFIPNEEERELKRQKRAAVEKRHARVRELRLEGLTIEKIAELMQLSVTMVNTVLHGRYKAEGKPR